jgi:alkanesulfonate monooxygenase SsuD/methylene tetrahydromethanopterin reductase-like flavin-dependent oxidoreductase (luciferase family)
MSSLRFSLAAPVFAAPGYPGMRTPSLESASWPVVRNAVERAEALDYESAWFSDHLFHGRDGAFFESWTALCIAAGFTNEIRLVNNHLGNGLRDARLLAKMATTLAVASDGRFDLFLATGYREREYHAYGLPWEPAPTRIRRLAEAIDVIRELWSGHAVDFDGEFDQLTEAVAAPSTAHQPYLWLGGPVEPDTAELIAHKADGWNSFPLSVADYRAAAEIIDAACVAAERDPASLHRSLETQVLVLQDESEWSLWLQRWRELRESAPLGPAAADLVPDPAELEDERVTQLCFEQFIVGTREHVAERIAQYRAAGVTDLVCWFMDAPAEASMTALAELAQQL